MTITDDLNSASILAISGQITESKRKEFEQTYRLASSTITKDCLLHNMSKDVDKEGCYHFVSLWINETELKKFTESSEYQMLNGAFHALGSKEHIVTGLLSGLKRHSLNRYCDN